MSALIPVDINGVTHEAHGEYTSAVVAKDFQNSLAAFRNIFILGLSPEAVVIPTATNLSTAIMDELENNAAYREQLKNALNGGTVTLNLSLQDISKHTDVTVLGLFNLAKDGIAITNNPSDANYDPVLRPGQTFLSLEMAGALEQLVRSLQMAGVNIQQVGDRLQVVGDITSAMIKNWKNLSASSDAIRSIMQYAIDTSGNQNRTLQALVELIYVRTGNELLSQSLERLEDAISVTKGSLDALNRLQVLHNKITAIDKEKFENVYSPNQRTTSFLHVGTVTQTTRLTAGTPSPTDFVKGLSNAAESHFAGIDPTLLSAITEQDRIEFMSLRATLLEEIAKLEAQTGQNQSGSLLEKMRTVLGDIHKAFSAVGISVSALASLTSADSVTNALTRWILDSNMVTNTSLNIAGVEPGSIQRNITAAVSAGQSLNDTQKEEVRRYLFVFEEYYKSAAAILTKITQLLERMAQAIAR